MTTVRTHDFRRTDTLDRQHIRAIDAMFDTFARHGSVELSTSLRKTAQLTISTLGEMSWREVTETLGERPYLATFNLDPLQGAAILSLSLETAIRLLDFRLGGGTQASYTGHTNMTDTDFAVLGEVITPLLVELSTSLSRVKEISAELVSQESSIQFMQLAAANEMFLVSVFRLTVTEDEPAEMIVALPFALVRQLIEAMHSATLARDHETLLIDESVVLETPIDLWLELPSIQLGSTEVSEMKVGDVIRFFHPKYKALDLRAEGVLVARAKRGSVGSKVVCSILEEVTTNDR
jgi:flagellar motor switch protein FliM